MGLRREHHDLGTFADKSLWPSSSPRLPDPWLSRGVREKSVGKLFNLAVELSKGEIIGTLVHAASAEEARAFGQDLFPGCNVMAVLHEGEPGAKND